MSIYYCSYCDRCRDADHHGINEHPQDECEGICDECLYVLEARAESLEEEEFSYEN